MTLTYEQVMTIRAALEAALDEKEEAETAMVYWYKKAAECRGNGRRSI